MRPRGLYGGGRFGECKSKRSHSTRVAPQMLEYVMHVMHVRYVSMCVCSMTCHSPLSTFLGSLHQPPPLNKWCVGTKRPSLGACVWCVLLCSASLRLVLWKNERKKKLYNFFKYKISRKKEKKRRRGY